MIKKYIMIKMFVPRYLLIIAMCSGSVCCYGQDAEEETGKLPVKSTFGAGRLIETPTIMSPAEKSLELIIQHRFSSMQNGISDIFGIYGAANTRIALNYGITDKIMVGYGTTMYNKLQDLNWKVALLKQNNSGSIPLSLSYFGNFVVDARDKEFFPPSASYRFIHRFSYFTEFIFARKFNDLLSLQVAPQFAYYNSTDTLHKNINYGISFGGRAKIWESKSILFEYVQPLTAGGDSKPSLAIGLEIRTATHTFQFFATNYQGIVEQQNLVYNTNNPFTKDFSQNFMFGFNITVRL
jgi:hypothetical protein